LKHLYNLFKSKGRKKPLSPFDISDYRKWLESQESVRSNVLTDCDIKISIIIPTYNSNIQFLSKAIESCICQTYRNFELILVDDCSEDHNVINLINKYVIKYNNIYLHKNNRREKYF
jgi:cellulose synthase/poly-beta-1,6-N-acetylglucosamine synthase-like glycosyltransferase